jgi:hypothetical protein
MNNSFKIGFLLSLIVGIAFAVLIVFRATKPPEIVHLTSEHLPNDLVPAELSSEGSDIYKASCLSAFKKDFPEYAASSSRYAYDGEVFKRTKERGACAIRTCTVTKGWTRSETYMPDQPSCGNVSEIHTFFLKPKAVETVVCTSCSGMMMTPRVVENPGVQGGVYHLPRCSEVRSSWSQTGGYCLLD